MLFQLKPDALGQILRGLNDDGSEYILTKLPDKDFTVECVLLKDLQRSSDPQMVERIKIQARELTVLADNLEKYVASWNQPVSRPSSLKAYFIENFDDVRRFLLDIHEIYPSEFHPDDDFKDFTDQNEAAVFTAEESEYLNSIMAQCFDICDKNNVEIYNIAGEVQVEIWKSKGIWPKP